MATARVNGVALSYRQVGTGPDVVFIHGLGANQAFWNLELVAALARSYRVTSDPLLYTVPVDGLRSLSCECAMPPPAVPVP